MEALLRRSVGEQIELKLNFEPKLWTAEADANQLESALLNLVINARDAMADGGTLTIQTDNLGIDYIQRRGAMIDAVTLDDAKRVAKRLYGSGMLVSIAGEPKGVASSD